jgi:hypothetical protein
VIAGKRRRGALFWRMRRTVARQRKIGLADALRFS